MKRILSVGALIAFTAPLALSQVTVNPPKRVGGATAAAATAKTTSKSAKSSATDEFIALERAFDVAYRSRDTTALDGMLTYDFISTDPTGRVWSKSELLQALASSKDESIATVTNDITQVNVFTNSSIVAGLISVTGKTPSGDIDLKFRYTNTFVKDKGKWLIAASQQTKVQP